MIELQQFRIITERSELDQPFLTPDQEFQPGKAEPAELSHFSDPHSARFVEPVSLIAAASISLIAYRILEHWLTRRECGVQIDARMSPATVTNISGIPTGFVVIISPDGTVTSHRSGSLTSDGLASLLASIVKG